MRFKILIPIIFCYFIVNSCINFKKNLKTPTKEQEVSITVYGDYEILKNPIHFASKILGEGNIVLRDDLYVSWQNKDVNIDDDLSAKMQAIIGNSSGVKIFLVNNIIFDDTRRFSGYTIRKIGNGFCSPVILLSRNHMKDSTLMHEIGHVLGLEHHKSEKNIMFRESSNKKTNLTQSQILTMRRRLEVFKFVCGSMF